MQNFTESHLALIFADNWEVTKYDDWNFYLQFQNCCNGNKGMNFLGIADGESTLWLIELKDYRGGRPRTKAIEIGAEVAIKARDTLAGLFAAKVAGGHDQQAFA